MGHFSSVFISVLECLTERYSNEEIYTWAGQALVALNPFREHPCLYGPESITRHHEQRLHETKVRRTIPYI